MNRVFQEIFRPLLTAAAIIVLTPMLWPQYSSCLAADAGAIKQKITAEQDKFERLRSGMEEHRDKIRVTRAQEETLLEDLEGIDQKLDRQRSRLKKLRGSLKIQEKLINDKIAELEKVTLAKDAARTKVAARLLAFYRMGKTGIMNVTFSAASLPDMLTTEEYYQVMFNHDQKLISGYRDKISRLSKIRDELQIEKDHMIQVIAGIKAQESDLAGTRANRMELLNRIHSEKRLYQQALVEMEKAAQRLSARIRGLKSEYRAAGRKRGRQRGRQSSKKRRPARGFASYKGRLDPPVAGTLSISFGRHKKDRFGITTFANGVDIRTENGAEVKAVAAGKVVYAGTLRGYGKIIIIDHGNQYYSLVSRLAEIDKSEGDLVSRGEKIGSMDEQEGIIGEGLHFEIRHGTEPQNPLKWIKAGKLKVEKKTDRG